MRSEKARQLGRDLTPIDARRESRGGRGSATPGVVAVEQRHEWDLPASVVTGMRSRVHDERPRCHAVEVADRREHLVAAEHVLPRRVRDTMMRSAPALLVVDGDLTHERRCRARNYAPLRRRRRIGARAPLLVPSSSTSATNRLRQAGDALPHGGQWPRRSILVVGRHRPP